jgi:3-keto-L-gulonate-6-phosphate decarboxylase
MVLQILPRLFAAKIIKMDMSILDTGGFAIEPVYRVPAEKMTVFSTRVSCYQRCNI